MFRRRLADAATGPAPAIMGAAMMAAAITGPARAAPDIAAVDACVAERVEADASPTDCVDAAHGECLAAPQDAPSVGALCFSDARGAWNKAIADEMARTRTRPDEALVAVIGIELKYDILAALVQCDRMRDLALAIGRQAPEEIRAQSARCSATALGLAYTRLKARTLALE